MIRIRRARTTDIAGIAEVVKDVWEQDILTEVCEAQIEGTSSALWVATAEADGQHPADTRHPADTLHPADGRHPAKVIGFASAFLTVDVSGHDRWEVDLVAVRPDRQGQGLGTHLISHVCEVGERNEVSLTRALIRVENIASQRAFEHVGFATDGQVHQLVLWSPRRGQEIPRDESEVKRSSPPVYAGRVALLPVNTLMYRGLWIEGLTSVCAEKQRLALETARAIAAREHRDNAGALIPVEKASFLATDSREEGAIHGEYYWFVKPGSKT